MPFDIYNPNKNLIHYSCRKTKILLSPEYWLANRIYSVDYRGFFCYKISVSPMSWKEQSLKIIINKIELISYKKVFQINL